MTDEAEKLTRKENVLIYVVGTIDGLRDKGLVQGGCTLGAAGAAIFRQLKDSGFRPTNAEMDEAMQALMRAKPCSLR